MTRERNLKIFERYGYGFGEVGGCNVDILRTITPEQLNEILSLILYGDFWEIGWLPETLGRHCPKDTEDAIRLCKDKDTEFILQLVAALVYLSGRTADEFKVLSNADISTLS